MHSKGHSFIVKAGDTVDLRCDFEADSFNLFDNPVLWRKRQDTEEVQINMLGNLLPPFNDSKKFTTYYEEMKPNYILGLTIISKFHCYSVHALVKIVLRC